MTETSKRLSIITINYNNCDGLINTIDSVLSQTFNSYEWIIIDGGSEDGSRELIEETIKNPSSNISFWCSEGDHGVYDAMNKGVQHASGMYVLFLNSGDCLASSTILSEIFCKEHSAGILYGDCFTSKQGRVVGTFNYPSKIDLPYLIEEGTLNTIQHNSTFIDLSLLRDNPYDTAYSIVADWTLWVHSILNGVSFEHLNTFVSIIDIEGMSSSPRNYSIMEKERRDYLEATLPKAVIESINDSNRVKKYLSNISIKEFIQIREKHPIMGKLLTGLVLLMRKLS